jgi:hypothetical protein
VASSPRPTKDRVSIFRSLQGLGAQPSPNGGPAFGRQEAPDLGRPALLKCLSRRVQPHPRALGTGCSKLRPAKDRARASQFVRAGVPRIPRTSRPSSRKEDRAAPRLFRNVGARLSFLNFPSGLGANRPGPWGWRVTPLAMSTRKQSRTRLRPAASLKQRSG